MYLWSNINGLGIFLLRKDGREPRRTYFCTSWYVGFGGGWRGRRAWQPSPHKASWTSGSERGEGAALLPVAPHGGSRAPPPASLSLLHGLPFSCLGFYVGQLGWALSHPVVSLVAPDNSCPSQIWGQLSSFPSADAGSLALLFACVLRSMLFSCELAE